MVEWKKEWDTCQKYSHVPSKRTKPKGFLVSYDCKESYFTYAKLSVYKTIHSSIIHHHPKHLCLFAYSMSLEVMSN